MKEGEGWERKDQEESILRMEEKEGKEKNEVERDLWKNV